MPAIGWAARVVLWILTTPQTQKHNTKEHPSCTGQWIKTSWWPPETQQGWADIHRKLGQHPTWAGSKIFEAWQVLLQDPYNLLPCNQILHISSAHFRQLENGPALLPPPCDPRCISELMEQWTGVSYLGCLSHGGRLGGTGAVPGQPWEEAEEGVCWPELLAKRIYLLLTTGTAELHNCSLPRVQGATSRQGQESFCDYFCSRRARFSPCSLKDFSHFSDSFPIRFFFNWWIPCSLKQCLCRLSPFVLIPKKQRNHIHASPTTLPNAAVKAFFPGWEPYSALGLSSKEICRSKDSCGHVFLWCRYLATRRTWVELTAKTIVISSYKDNPF